MKMWQESIANHKKYINQDIGMFLDKYTQDRVCPVCEIHNEIEIFIKEVLDINNINVRTK
ncbi:hypothetical protein N9S07_02575 [Nitrosomonadales bacterium]|nr:hypothetical protein [Nitrosomonadales bacterium]